MASGHSFRQNSVGGLSACLSCGSVLQDDAEVCPACGKPVALLKTINTLDARVGPRTDMPLNAATPLPAGDAQSAEVLPKFLPERYEPVKLLGQGGMGAVYHCIDRQLERPVAIKVMTDKFRSSPQGETRFMREARAQAIVNHTNVSTILNFGVSPEGKLFLVMEYLEGEDLRDFLRKRGKLDPMLACELMRQALDGLQEAHACGLVHRDLKPSNLMVIKDHRGQPWVKILDLGLAKMVGGQTDLLTITMDTANQLIGTPAYMSPEQVAGSKVDSRADLYSMGVVFYEMLAGRLPFESESLPGWLYQHLHEIPEMPSHYNGDLLKYPHIDKLPMWLLEKKPEDRPQTAAAMVAVLKNILAGKSIADLIPASMRGETSPDNGNRAGSSSHSIPSAGSSSMGSGSRPGAPAQTPPARPPTPPGVPTLAPGSSTGARQPVKFSSIPTADRARYPQAIPGITRRPFGAGPTAGKMPPAQPSAPPRAPGVVRQPLSAQSAPALARFSNVQQPPPARTPQANSSNSAINLVSSISGLDPEQARTSYDNSCSDAMNAEAASNWKLALKNWLRAQALADMYGCESPAARLDACKHQVEIEKTLAKSENAAKAGDWQTADDLLTQLTQPHELDARIETAKANLPRRLVTAWMGLAAQKVRALREGDLRRELSERYTITCAASGDIIGAINFLDATPRRAELRIVSFAQAVAAAIRHGHTDGMRPYLDRLKGDLTLVTDPGERGKTSLEVGRTFAVYGDLENAATSLRDAFKFFGEALNRGIPISVSDRSNASDTRITRPTPVPSASPAPGKPTAAGKSVRASWLTAISALADAQAEAGLIDDCLRSASAIDDPWTKALVMSQLVQNFTKTGRHELAERQAASITFALPKTQALRAIAISKIYREDVLGAEELLTAIPTPAERLPIIGVLAVYYGLRKDPTKPRSLISNLLSSSKQINGALPRFNALAAAAEPMLSAGLNDMARTVFEEALQLVTLIEDPVERVRCLLHLVKLKEVRRDAIHSTTRTVAFAAKPATHLLDMLRQALFAARQLRTDRDKMECFENMGTRVAAAYLPIVATEMFNAFRDDADQASIYIGLSAGMV